MNNSPAFIEDSDLPEESVIAPDSTMKGELRTDKNVRVFGTFEGNISCQNVMIEEHGAVIGDIDAETVSVAGTLNGEVSADNFIVAQTATVEGNIVALRYGIEPGAQIPSAALKSPQNNQADSRSARRHPRVVMPHESKRGKTTKAKATAES